MRNIVLAGVLIAAGLAAWLWWSKPEAGPAVAERPERVDAGAAPVPSTPVEVSAPAREPAAAPPPPPSAGFCATDEGPSSITIRHTLKGLARRLTAKGDAELLAEVKLALESEDARDRLAAVRRAWKLKPKDPALGWELAALTRHSAELDEAIEGLAAYLAADPNPDLARMRALLEVQRDIQRDYQQLERGPTTLRWATEALSSAQADEVLYQVNRSLDDAARLSGTRRRDQLTVVVYPGRSELLAVTCVRSWTAGVYDGTLRLQAERGVVDLKVLRHETLHAQVSRHASSAPRWFHEGLAQSFAEQAERRGRWAMMVKNRVWVPFSSLDGSFQAFEASDDAALAYTQSYAMVELMRSCGGDGAVSRAIEAFEKGGDTERVLASACGRPISGNDLLDYMAKQLGP